ncbi:MAG: DUF421 domain-containing protein [Acidimicrobiia bacterium]|nr:DUF421 domain-containing protein [Acidimicrobiia bacterium]NNF08751.1 DUF421 domain-containing protein [Acidimicrobiia bacterium]
MSTEIFTSWSDVGFVVLSATAMVVGVVLYVQIIGLRSFAKMSSFDFAVTVAMGSLLAAVTLSNSSLIEGLIAVASLLGVQAIIALGRRRFGWVSRLVDNTPTLLMAGSEMLTDNLRRVRVTEDDVRGKLREANVRNYDEVRYVVLETTGDVSVVHGGGHLDPDIFSDVSGADRIPR